MFLWNPRSFILKAIFCMLLSHLLILFSVQKIRIFYFHSMKMWPISIVQPKVVEILLSIEKKNTRSVCQWWSKIILWPESFRYYLNYFKSEYSYADLHVHMVDCFQPFIVIGIVVIGIWLFMRLHSISVEWNLITLFVLMRMLNWYCTETHDFRNKRIPLIRNFINLLLTTCSKWNSFSCISSCAIK